MDKNRTPLSIARAGFRLYNQTTGKSPHTIKWYEFRLALFERWLGPAATVGDVTVPRVRAYVAELQNRNQRHPNNPFVKNKDGQSSSSYVNGFVRALRAFARWLAEDGLTESNMLALLKPPKIQQKVVEVLTDDEIAKLVAVFDQNDLFGARNYAIVWTLLDCGLRASELCDLKLVDAHLEQGYLKVLGKGNKERLVPIGQHCQDTLVRWRDRVRPKFAQDESTHFFLSSNGVPLTITALENVVLRAGHRAGVKRAHCHLLRHTFATNYLVRQVGDPLRLQQILGHTSLEMVRRYVAIANVQQSLIERRDSPMDLVLAQRNPSQNARRLQPRRSRKLRLVK